MLTPSPFISGPEQEIREQFAVTQLIGAGITLFGGILVWAILQWMRSVYVALYNLNRLVEPITEARAA